MADSLYEPPDTVPTDPGEKPAGLDLYAGLNAALGLLGLMGACMGCFGLVSALAFTDALGGMGAMMPSEQATAYTDLMAASKRLVPLSALVVTMTLVSATLLALGGMRTLMRSEGGPRLLRTGVLVALFVDPLRVALQLVSQLLIREENAAYMQASMSGPGMPSEVQQFLPYITAGMIVATVAFALLWLAIKVLLYGLTLRRLNALRGY